MVTEFLLPPGRGPLNITVGSDNHLWFTEQLGNMIGRLNPLAGTDASIQNSLFEIPVPGNDSAPHDIVAGPDDALWFTQSGSDQIGRITNLGRITDEFTVPGVGSAPAGITLGPDDALWFTESGSGEIGRISLQGNVTEFLIPKPTNSISDPEDITLGPGGALFFTDFGRDQIGRITPAGVITQFNLPTGRGPHQIVAGQDGNLYFTQAAGGRIARFTTSALLPGQPTSGAVPLIEFADNLTAASTPLGLTNDSNGDIWFTLNATNSVARFDTPIAQLTAVATGGTVQVYDVNLNLIRSFTPFPGFNGPLSVAVGDFTGNSVPDVVVGMGQGGPPRVRVYEGTDNALLADFLAFPASFRGGITVGADHVRGSVAADVIIGTGPGIGARVKIVDSSKMTQLQSDGVISDDALLGNFLAFAPSFQGGVTVASGDFNGDSRADIIIGQGRGGFPRVLLIDGARLGELEINQSASSSAARLADFLTFKPGFRGGVTVATMDVNFDGRRDLIVGQGPGSDPRVLVVDGNRRGQLQSNGVISDAALLANFLAFAPSFRGGVTVAADDINSDGQAEIFVGAGPGTTPQVVVIDASKRNQLMPNGQIAPGALVGNFVAGNPTFRGGAIVAADADHRDGPVFGPPGITVPNSRRDINDQFLFQSPTNSANAVLVMTVSPFSTATTPNTFLEGVGYEFRIANRDILNTTDDLTFRVTFGPADAAGVQDVAVRALPASRFPGSGGVLAKGLTGQNVAVRGTGGLSAMFRAAEQDDPFFFDAGGFNALLNNATAVQGVVDGDFPRGTSPNGFGPDSTPNFNAPNFFGPQANTLAMVLELPFARLTARDNNAIGMWSRTDLFGVQLDRMGRPAIRRAA